jgi:hypothetical protein
MRTVALVEVWGRLMMQHAGVRGEHGRVLAIAVADDDPPQRRERAEASAGRDSMSPVNTAGDLSGRGRMISKAQLLACFFEGGPRHAALGSVISWNGVPWKVAISSK